MQTHIHIHTRRSRGEGRQSREYFFGRRAERRRGAGWEREEVVRNLETQEASPEERGPASCAHHLRGNQSASLEPVSRRGEGKIKLKAGVSGDDGSPVIGQ